MSPLALALGLLIGLTLGLLGAGGSVLTVPIFIYVLGIEPKPAIAMSLAVVGTTAFAGCLAQLREGQAHVRLALTFGIFAIVGALAGARLALRIPETVQLVLFGIVVMTSALLMLRSGNTDRRNARDGVDSPRAADAAAVGAEGARAPEEGGGVFVLPRGRRLALLAAQALAIGVLTAMIGVGGGFLIVPSLVLLYGLPMREAVGTSLLVITMNALSGFAGYVGHVAIDWGVVLPFIAAAIVGILTGSRLAPRVPQALLKQGFAVMLLAVGVYVLVRR
ncbi:MAG: sulfite exporter TauE/SafE family protein [Gemmatimonadaceae bacterium]